MKLKYGFIGDGNTSKHFQAYFSALQIPFAVWSRRIDPSEKNLATILGDCNVFLILIKDDVIESFIRSQPFLSGKTLIHFSGALSTSLALGAHPLMTFKGADYHIEEYKKMHFITDFADFHTHFPSLPNPHTKIDASEKALYHALCVMAGNFPQLLWLSIQKDFRRMNIPTTALYVYLQKNLQNTFTLENPQTGPLVRNDLKTIEKNVLALEGSNLQSIYKNFVEIYSPEIKEYV